MHQTTLSSIQATADFNKQALLFIGGAANRPNIEPATKCSLPQDYSSEDYSKLIAGLLLEILRDDQIPELDSQGQQQTDNNGELIQTTRLKFIRRFLYKIPPIYYLLFDHMLFDQDLNMLRPFLEATLYNMLTAPYDEYNQRLFTYVLSPTITPHKISQEDIEFIEVMLKHKKLRECILLINQIVDGTLVVGTCSEAAMQTHVNELVDELKHVDVYLMKDLPSYGLTTFRQKIYFKEKLFITKKTASLYQKDRTRVIRLITIIHEIFWHLKRLKYGVINDTLKPTPDLLINDNDNIKESGIFREVKLFGAFVEKSCVTEEFIQRFFREETWTNSLNIDVPILTIQNEEKSNQQSQKNLSRKLVDDDSLSEENSSSGDEGPDCRCIRAHHWLMEQRRNKLILKEKN